MPDVDPYAHRQSYRRQRRSLIWVAAGSIAMLLLIMVARTLRKGVKSTIRKRNSAGILTFAQLSRRCEDVALGFEDGTLQQLKQLIQRDESGSLRKARGGSQSGLGQSLLSS